MYQMAEKQAIIKIPAVDDSQTNWYVSVLQNQQNLCLMGAYLL